MEKLSPWHTAQMIVHFGRLNYKPMNLRRMIEKVVSATRKRRVEMDNNYNSKLIPTFLWAAAILEELTLIVSICSLSFDNE